MGGRARMILPNDFQRQWQDTVQSVMDAVRAVGAGGWYILGAEVREFEKELAQRWGLAHAVGVGSGLDAIEIGLRALGCKAGDRVLTSPISAFATTLAILKLGAIPVFVDTDQYGLIDLRACRDVLFRRRDIRYFVPVHLYGHALDVNELATLRAQYDCFILEDCAQSIGASYAGRPTGTAGDMAATSFYPTKNLGALGDGGAALTNSDEDAVRLCVLRDYGQSAKYRHNEIGYNSRLDELHAAIIRRAYLPKLAEWTCRRREIALRYLSGIRNAAISCLGAPDRSESCWHLFPVLVAAERKQAFLEYAKAAGVLCGEHYPIAIPKQEAMQKATFEMESDCAAAIRFCSQQVSLPIHPYLEDSEVERVIEVCNEWPG
jgi:dTDP-4-amino-4,6-dideoxygalactose transaminase